MVPPAALTRAAASAGMEPVVKETRNDGWLAPAVAPSAAAADSVAESGDASAPQPAIARDITRAAPRLRRPTGEGRQEQHERHGRHERNDWCMGPTSLDERIGGASTVQES